MTWVQQASALCSQPWNIKSNSYAPASILRRCENLAAHLWAGADAVSGHHELGAAGREDDLRQRACGSTHAAQQCRSMAGPVRPVPTQLAPSLQQSTRVAVRPAGLADTNRFRVKAGTRLCKPEMLLKHASS